MKAFMASELAPKNGGGLSLLIVDLQSTSSILYAKSLRFCHPRFINVEDASMIVPRLFINLIGV